MKRIFVYLFLHLLVSLGTQAQEKPFLLNGQLLNGETLEPISDEIYHKIYIDTEDRIHVQHGPAWVWGIIDRQGNTVIKPRYNSMLYFSEGIAIGAVKGLGMSYEVIDEKGEILFDNKAKSLRPYRNGLAAFLGDGAKYGFFDKKGKQIIKAQYDGYSNNIRVDNDHYIVVQKGEKWGIVNGKNKTKLPFEYEAITWLKDDIFLIEVPDAETPTTKGSFGSTIHHSDYGLWSVSKGMVAKPTINFIHSDFKFLEFGYLKARLSKFGLWNLIDLNANKVLPNDHHELLPISASLIGVGKTDPATRTTSYAVSDFKGNLYTRHELFSVGKLSNGLFSACLLQNKQFGCGYLDEKVQLKIPMTYRTTAEFSDSGFAIVGRHNGISGSSGTFKGIIDKNNKMIVPLVFGQIRQVSSKYFRANVENNGFEHLIKISDGLPIGEKGTLYLMRSYAAYYLFKSDFANASIFYQKVKDSGNADSDDLASLGKSYSRSGQYEEAIKNLDEVLRLPPGRMSDRLKSYRGEKAYALWKLGKIQEAKVAYDETFAGFTKNMTEEYSNMRLEYAEMLHEMNLGNDAIKQYEEVLRYYTNAWWVYDKLGVLQLTIDLKDESIQSFTKSIGFNPYGKDSYFYRGQAYSLKNEHTKAIKDYEKAIQLEGSGQLTTIHGYLADSYFASGVKDKACGIWKQLAPYDEKAKAKAGQNCK